MFNDLRTKKQCMKRQAVLPVAPNRYECMGQETSKIIIGIVGRARCITKLRGGGNWTVRKARKWMER